MTLIVLNKKTKRNNTFKNVESYLYNNGWLKIYTAKKVTNLHVSGYILLKVEE